MLSRLFFSGRKSPQKRVLRPLSYTLEKRPETNKRPLAFDSEKRAETKKARITSLPSPSNAKLKKQSAIFLVQEEDLVGSVHESDVDHWKRHGVEPSLSPCGPCIFIPNKAELQREHPWLTPRPSFMGGHWRLGCDACHWLSKNSQREQHQGRRGCKVRASCLAAFNFVPNGVEFQIRKKKSWRIVSNKDIESQSSLRTGVQKLCQRVRPLILTIGHQRSSGRWRKRSSGRWR